MGESIPSDAELRSPPASRPGRVLPWAVLSAIAVPLVAVLVYASVGSPAIVGLDPETLRGQLTPETISKAVAELEEQVRRNPQDGEAWAMLAEARRLGLSRETQQIEAIMDQHGLAYD